MTRENDGFVENTFCLLLQESRDLSNVGKSILVRDMREKGTPEFDGERHD